MLSSSEQMLIAMAEQDLSRHGVVIEDFDPDADIQAVVEESQTRVDALCEEIEVDDGKQLVTNFDLFKSEEKPLSKKEQAVAIYNTIKECGRGEVLNQFIAQLSMSKATASTYYQNIKSGKWS